MATKIRLSRVAGVALLAIGGGLMLAGCNNQYGPPVPGQPLTWGQQFYLDNQRQIEMNQNRMP
jgi:hypothetical protein